MRKVKLLSKFENIFGSALAKLTIYVFFLTFLTVFPNFNPIVVVVAFTFNWLLLFALYRFWSLKDLFEDRVYITLNSVFLLLTFSALLGEKIDWFHLKEVRESYYLFFLGSLVGVLSATFLRKRPKKGVLLLATYSVLLASKNIFVTVGFALANLVSADIYGRYRKTLYELFAVAVGNAIFTLLLAGDAFVKNPSAVWSYLLFYPFSVVVDIFLLFGLQKLLDLIPFMYSDEKLKNLASLSNPLLEEMLLKAPGTYHHSVIVSLLSESVAKKIGADPLLTKVGAMFHDIGKLINPQYFIENVNGENPHTKLKPETSAAIIKSHVEEGLKLAKKYNLPKEIVRFIPEHQGTKLIGYFYAKALQENPNVLEEKFRYKGPVPQSKETAIVMIADTVEAMVRALKNPTPEDIKRVVKTAIGKLIEENQLKNSQLTEKDLQLIEKLLAELLISYYHERIKYPTREKSNGRA